MANERLRSALLRRGITLQAAAAALDVDAKTVERWITKERTPYPRHRYALSVLLDEPEDNLWPEVAAQRQFADVEAVFSTRAEFAAAMPPRELFGKAQTIDIAGLSLNLLCQQYSDSEIVDLVSSGTTMRCLFLDPAGQHIRAREAEEGHEPGVLVGLTDINIGSLARLRNRCRTGSTGTIAIRTYDETVRFNIIVIDGRTCITQPYLPNARGVESPTFVARRSDRPGIFDTFTRVFETMWAGGKDVAAK